MPKDHFGDGSITVADAGGRTVYQAQVRDFDFDAGDYTNPSATETAGETISKYLDDGRVQHTTRWKSARGAIDPQNPPIAGVGGVPTADGVTNQYVYFEEIAGTASRAITRLGGGSGTININAAITKLGERGASFQLAVIAGSAFMASKDACPTTARPSPSRPTRRRTRRRSSTGPVERS